MIQVQEHVSLRRQRELLAISRSGLYYEPVGTSALMRRIDEIHLKCVSAARTAFLKARAAEPIFGA